MEMKDFERIIHWVAMFTATVVLVIFPWALVYYVTDRRTMSEHKALVCLVAALWVGVLISGIAWLFVKWRNRRKT
jgi:hypothetical protein